MARYTTNPWRAEFVLAFWIIQMILLLGKFTWGVCLIALTVYYRPSLAMLILDNGWKGLLVGEIFGLATIIMLMSIVAVQMTLFHKRKLWPAACLVMELIKGVAATIAFAIKISAIVWLWRHALARDENTPFAIVGTVIYIVVSILLLLAFLVTLIYAGLVSHKTRKGQLDLSGDKKIQPTINAPSPMTSFMAARGSPV